MGEIKAADACAWPHGTALGQRNAGVFLHVQQVPQNPFLSMIRAGGIPGGGPDAAILFADQIVDGELFGFPVAPLLAHAPVQVLREGFRQSIRQRLRHD